MRNISTSTRNSYPIKILQFGGGNFLRGFFNWMVEEMTEFHGDVIVVQPTPFGTENTLKLLSQEYRYTVLLKEGHDEFPYVIQNIKNIVDPYLYPNEYYKLAGIPDLQFVISNTTEAGLVFDNEDQFINNPPHSFPGKLTKLLYLRYKLFSGDYNKGLIMLPCEIIRNNGTLLKDFVLKYAVKWELDYQFQVWVNCACFFYNTLVNRIVTGFPKDDYEAVFESLGYKDKMLTVGEYYHNWIIEAPKSLEKIIPFSSANLNVNFVDNIEYYWERQIRILNALHTMLAPIGVYFGLKYVSECMNNQLIKEFLLIALQKEIIPSFAQDQLMLYEYADGIIKRFQNPSLKHSISDILLNSISKYKSRILPSASSYYKKYRRIPDKLTLTMSLILYLFFEDNSIITFGIRENAKIINIIKKYKDYQYSDLSIFLHEFIIELFGEEDKLFIDKFEKICLFYLTSINKRGVAQVITDVCAEK